MFESIKYRIETYQFVFTELMKRDFKKKYKRSVLGVLWSLLSPLFTLLVMNLIFGSFFGSTYPYYTIYLFTGIIIVNYFMQTTTTGMGALVGNAHIYSKVNVPKWLFLLSNISSSSINFGLTLVLYLFFVFLAGLPFTWDFFFILFPLICLMILVAGVSMILSALYVFFEDIQYLYSIFIMAIGYCTPVFYTPDILGDMEWVFYYNPFFLYINYIREIVIFDRIPSLDYHIACFAYAIVFLLIGFGVYKKYNYRFLYYV